MPYADGNPTHLRNLWMSPEVLLDSRDVKSAEAILEPATQRAMIRVNLNNQGGMRFRDATQRYVGRQSGVVMDGKIKAAPIVAAPIRVGVLEFPATNLEEATALAKRFNASVEGGVDLTQPAAVVRLRTYLIETKDDPAKTFSLKHKTDSLASKRDEVEAWNLSITRAQEIVEIARKTAGIKVLAAPVITTRSGREAGIEVGDVPGKRGEYAVNAKGYISIKEPKAGAKPVLIGQSVELLPEITPSGLIITGRFASTEKAKREGEDFPRVETRHAGPVYARVPSGGAFALTQGSRIAPQGKNGKQHLLLVVIPSIEQNGDAKSHP